MSHALSPLYTFDSVDIGEGEAFGRYHDLYSIGSDVRRAGPDFRARLQARRLGSLILFDRLLNDVSHERTPARVNGDGFSHFTLQLVLSGRMIVEHGGGAREAGPGEIALFDLTRPQRTTARNLRLLTFSVPRAMIERSTIHVDMLHGRVLDVEEAGVLGDVMASITRRHLSLAAGDPAPVLRVLEAALALALRFGTQATSRFGGAGVLERTRLVVEANLSRRDLSPALVSHLTGVSRTVLYDLFKPSGGVSRYIQQRRVIRLRRLIQEGASPGATVAQLAFRAGFASDSHANRSFAKTYGITPRRFQTIQDQPPTEVAGASASDPPMIGWLRALN